MPADFWQKLLWHTKHSFVVISILKIVIVLCAIFATLFRSDLSNGGFLQNSSWKACMQEVILSGEGRGGERLKHACRRSFSWRKAGVVIG
jgi:hypothetical protein